MASKVSRAVELAKKAEKAAAGSKACTQAMDALWPLITIANANEVGAAVVKAAPGLPRKCVEAMGMNAPSAEAAGKALWKLSRTDDNQVPLRKTPGLVDALVRAASSGATDGIKEAALGALQCLTIAADNRVPLCKTPGLVDALVRAASSGATDGIKEAALGALANLALAADNQVPLRKTPGLVDALVQAASSGATDGAKQAALSALGNLAIADDNTSTLAQWPGLVDLLVRSCSSAHEASRRQATATLLNLTTSSASAAVVNTSLVIAALAQGLKDSNPDTQRRAAMALANLVGGDEKRAHMLTSDTPILNNIVSVLRMALDKPGPGSWELEVPLQALRSLSLLPANRAVFVNAGLPALLTRAVGVALDTNDTRAAEFALAMMQQLAFDEPTLELLKVDAALPPLLGRVAAHSETAWGDARRAAQYLDFKLTGKSEAVSSSSATQAQPRHVMISYSWANQDLGRRVDAYFSERQCVVWRDERNMQGNIVDAMMKGVLESEFFVCLVSRAYFNSANCRAEFEFAKKNKRKIVPINVETAFDLRDTWLGFHLGDALYYAIVPEFDGPMAQLFAKEIGGAALERRASRRMSGAPPPVPAKTSTAPATKDSVLAWLTSADLADLFPVLEREGFGEKRFAKLRRMPATELATMFKFSNAAAIDLWDALQQATW